MINIVFDTKTYYPYYRKSEDGTRYMMLSASKGLYLKKKSMSFFEVSRLSEDDREYLRESAHISYNEWAENAQKFIRKFCDINKTSHFKKYPLSDMVVFSHGKIFTLCWRYLIIDTQPEITQGTTLVGEIQLSSIEETLLLFAKYTAFPKRHNSKEYSL